MDISYTGKLTCSSSNDSKEEDKENFYNRLRSVVQMCPGGNMVIPMVIWKIQQIRETSRN